MIRPEVRDLAKTGRLLTAKVEESREVGQVGKAHYQAMADTVEPLRDRDYVEIVDIPPEAIADVRGLVSKRRIAIVDHIPLDLKQANANRVFLGFFAAGRRDTGSGRRRVEIGV